MSQGSRGTMRVDRSCNVIRGDDQENGEPSLPAEHGPFMNSFEMIIAVPFWDRNGDRAVTIA